MKICELCNKVARMYCESDKASLCWDCDSRVHSANFLVAKHSRTLLCHACQRLTPWTGSGPRLGPTVAVCEACAREEDDHTEGNGRQSEDDDDAQNQVVPLALPPSLGSTSSDISSTSSDRFSYHVSEKAEEEKNGGRSWGWR